MQAYSYTHKLFGKINQISYYVLVTFPLVQSSLCSVTVLSFHSITDWSRELYNSSELVKTRSPTGRLIFVSLSKYMIFKQYHSEMDT